MSIGNVFKGIIGYVNLEQEGNIIIIRGIDGYLITKAIQKLFNTSKVSSYMLTSYSSNNIKFQQYFLPDIYYIFKKLINQTNIYFVPRKKLLTAIEEMLEKTYLKDLNLEHRNRLDLNLIDDLRYPPYINGKATGSILPHQLNFIKHYNTELTKTHLNGCLLNAAPGSGKSILSLAISYALKSEKVIIICPLNSVYTVWDKTISELFPNKPKTYVAANKNNYGNEKYLIFHYETLNNALELSSILKKYDCCIILDECHNLNEIKSQRTINFINFCKILNCNNVIFQSGTPVKALGNELIPLFKCIDPYFNPSVEERFRKIYGSEAKQTLELLNNRLNTVQFKITKDVLNLDKPQIYTINVKIPDNDKYTLKTIKDEMTKFINERVKYYSSIKEDNEDFYYYILDQFEKLHVKTKQDKDDFYKYKEYIKKIINAYNRKELDIVKEEIIYCNKYELKVIIPLLNTQDSVKFKDIRSVIKYVGLKIQGECLGRVLGRKRIECSLAMLPYIDIQEICDSTLKKTLVFTSYVEVVEELLDQLSKKGMKPISVYGKNTTDLVKTIKEFENNPILNPLIATFQSLSTAVPLIMADTLIMLNTPFRDYIVNQTISRVHRLGANSQVRVFNVLLDTGSEPNISTRSLDILTWAQEQVQAITGITSDYGLSNTETISVERYREFYEDNKDADYNIFNYCISIEEYKGIIKRIHTITKKEIFDEW